MMSNKRHLGFTIQGEFINDLAIERCFIDGEIPEAIELLTSCLVTDELSDGDRLALAIDILDGKVLMKGVYPGDYHLEETTPKKPERTVANKIKDMVQQLKDQKAEIRKYQQQITAVAEYLSGSWKGERELGLINAYWQREYDDTSRIWELGQAAEESMTGADALLKAITGSDDPVQEFLDRQRRPNLDEDYGWLAPDGTFHAVKFGEHQGWARVFCKKHFPEFKEGLQEGAQRIVSAGDWLQERGWVLLHNPGMGLARPTCSDVRRLTKAQREFLYGYYIDRGRSDMANKYFLDE